MDKYDPEKRIGLVVDEWGDWFDVEIVLTPTYYVFKMYSVHQDAVMLRVDLQCASYADGRSSIPALSASASKDREGRIHISVANLNPTDAESLRCELRGTTVAKISGEIVTAATMTAYNDFGRPDAVDIVPLTVEHLHDGILTVALPPKSVVTFELK